MSDLKLDMAVLDQLKADLNAIVKEFDDADDVSDDAGDATGHDELAGDLHDFAHRWNDKRKKMLEDIKTLAQSVAEIADNFDKTDTELAKALEQAAAAGAKSYPPVVKAK